MKTVLLNKSSKVFDNDKIECIENKEKIREKIKKLKDNSNNNIIIEKFNTHIEQIKLINRLFLGEIFIERKFLLSELKNKLSSYKNQDIKKDLHEECNLITLDNIINKLVNSKLKCFYCNEKMYILFEKVRDNKQWTLDRLNNYDEHTDKNTIVCCLQCNLQRRRKNSEKFKFTKQLETKQLKINKINYSI
tara:strand:- start:11627 stop:12199 length:573 start_codon:yes stop_codon:yes gene_type:complete